LDENPNLVGVVFKKQPLNLLSLFGFLRGKVGIYIWKLQIYWVRKA